MSEFKIIVVFILSFLIAPMTSAETPELNDQQWKLTEEQWDLVKQGEQLLKMPKMRQMVDVWSSRQGQTIELRYPGGEAGELWVEELKDWLISLAIPSQYLFAVPGSGDADVIIIKIVKLGDM
ncbi:MAG: hypothetical protein OQK32_06610 [Gammaproteobacteria bacterium]|nr:hypothetical protein [Gammaproteobacteria bacterium]MCW8924116.1 hypothetical protein [Gammaproteobacteria bacterium]